MVVNIPTADEFEGACLGSLNLAWQTAYDLLLQEEQADIATWDDNNEVTDEYWQSAQPILRNAISLIQQAHELGLKGKIASISPYLLIAQDPSRWPSGASGPVTFSTFRTLDAIDLPKAMELFSTPLTSSFSALYEDIRKKRNNFSHGVSRGERVAAIDVLKYILATFEELFPGQRWPAARLAYLLSDPAAVAFSSDHAHPRLLREVEAILNSLTRAEAARFFGVNTKARWYKCAGTCYEELRNDEFANGDRPHFAQLTPPKTKGASQLFCFVCGETVQIQRKKCTSLECPADVILKDEDGTEVCLTCEDEQEVAGDCEPLQPGERRMTLTKRSGRLRMGDAPANQLLRS